MIFGGSFERWSAPRRQPDVHHDGSQEAAPALSESERVSEAAQVLAADAEGWLQRRGDAAPADIWEKMGEAVDDALQDAMMPYGLAAGHRGAVLDEAKRMLLARNSIH